MSGCTFQWATEPREDGRRRAVCPQCGTRTGWVAVGLELIRGNCLGTTPAARPGYELTQLLLSLDLTGTANCGCKEKAAEMDAWGVDGCQERRAEITGWLQEAAAKRGWVEKIQAGAKLLQQPWFNPLDPYGSIVDEAVRRAATSSAEAAASTGAPAR